MAARIWQRSPLTWGKSDNGIFGSGVIVLLSFLFSNNIQVLRDDSLSAIALLKESSSFRP
jgi:hypothetical protein